VFKLGNSIARYRTDPAWVYEERSHAPYTRFDERSFPFSLGRRSSGARNFLSGVVAGYEATLFHLLLDPNNNSGSTGKRYSVAVLELPRALPATAMVDGRLLRDVEKRPWQTPLRHGPWKEHPALPHGGGSGVRCIGDDFAFSRLVATDKVLRLTDEGELQWRIEDCRLIGWVWRQRPYEDIIALAERLAAILAAFPRAAWQWPTVR
jgi:hypothetical protein